MNFWEASLTTRTSFIIVVFVSKISSTPYTVKDVSFSSASYVACYTLPYAVANSHVNPKPKLQVFPQPLVHLLVVYIALVSLLMVLQILVGPLFYVTCSFTCYVVVLL
jgi:hypothetical protein